MKANALMVLMAFLVAVGMFTAPAAAQGAPEGASTETCGVLDIPCWTYPYEVGGGIRLEAVTCPASHPQYCSNVNLCFEDWVSCGTIGYCQDNYYGCHSGEQMICVNNNNPLCFDQCVDDRTVGWCDDNYYGCWKDNCNSGCMDCNNWNCVDGNSWCCPDAKPVYNAQYQECVKTDFECKYDSDCSAMQECDISKNHCVAGPSYSEPTFLYCFINEVICDSSGATPIGQEVTEVPIDSNINVWCYINDGSGSGIDGAEIEYSVDGNYVETLHTSGGWVYFPGVWQPGDPHCYPTGTGALTAGDHVLTFLFTGEIEGANGLSPKSFDWDLKVGGNAPEPPPADVGGWFEQLLASIQSWFCSTFGWWCA